MLIKICGITSAADARVAVAAGAGAVGLNFYPRSPRCVSAETAAEIIATLPAGVWRVGVFVDAPAADVAALVEGLGLDTLQFHGTESPDYCARWSQRVIKAVRVRDPQTLEAAAAYPVDFILADAYVEGLAGGTGATIPAEWVTAVKPDRLILAGGLTADNVAAAVRRLRPAGVDVASGVERSPGRKDPEQVKRFIANAQHA
jgi:phosphoribosylanthranilate isomerase